MASTKTIIITAPSGSGKTTLVKKLLKQNPRLAFSVSACTRKPRPGEVNGADYYFLSEKHFQELIEKDAFLEWEMVYPGKYYGTLRSELSRIEENGCFPVIDIDVKGALSVKKVCGDVAFSIFIKAPSEEILRQRLRDRGTETEASLKERVEKAAYENTFAEQFDCIVVNDCLDTACKELLDRVESFLNADTEVISEKSIA